MQSHLKRCEECWENEISHTEKISDPGTSYVFEGDRRGSPSLPAVWRSGSENTKTTRSLQTEFQKCFGYSENFWKSVVDNEVMLSSIRNDLVALRLLSPYKALPGNVCLSNLEQLEIDLIKLVDEVENIRVHRAMYQRVCNLSSVALSLRCVPLSLSVARCIDEAENCLDNIIEVAGKATVEEKLFTRAVRAAVSLDCISNVQDSMLITLQCLESDLNRLRIMHTEIGS